MGREPERIGGGSRAVGAGEQTDRSPEIESHKKAGIIYYVLKYFCKQEPKMLFDSHVIHFETSEKRKFALGLKY